MASEQRIINDLAERYQNDALLHKRLTIVLLSSQRMKSGEIARKLQITPSTIVLWIKRFNRLGLACFEPSLTRDPAASPTTLPDSEPLFARELTEAEIETLQQLMETYRARTHTLRRFQAILLSSQGMSVSEIVRRLGLSQKTVRFWIKQFNSQGMQRLETFGDKNWLLRQQTLALKGQKLSLGD
jgi:transposase